MSSTTDPITTEVIRNAFYAIADDVSAVLNRSAYSPVIYESHDYGISIYNEKVQLLAQAPGTPYFTGGLEAAVEAGRWQIWPGQDERRRCFCCQ